MNIFQRDKIIRLLEKFIEVSFILIIFITPIYFAVLKENANIFELNKLVVFRSLLILIIITYIAKIFLQEKIVYLGNKYFYLSVLFLAAAFIISSALSISPNYSYWGNYMRQQGLYSLLSYILFFVMLILNLKTYAQIKKLFFTAILSSAAVSLYGILQYLALDPFKWSVDAFSMGRIFSTLGQPNFLGQYLIMVIPLTVYYFIFITKGFLKKFFMGLVILLQLSNLIFTYSRAAWLGFFAGFAILFLLIFITAPRQIYKYLISAVLIIIFLITGAYFLSHLTGVFYSTGNEIRVNRSFDMNQGSNKIRLFYWRAAISQIKSENLVRLLIGNGPEVLVSIYLKYYRPEWGIFEAIDDPPDRSHNAVLDIIISFGLVGFFAIMLFYYFIISAAIKYLLRNKTEKTDKFWLIMSMLLILAAYFVYDLFSFSLTVSYIYLYLAVAVIWLTVNLDGRENQVKISLHKISRLLILLSTAIVGGMFIYLLNIKIFIADHYYMNALKAKSADDCQAVINNLEKSVAYNPQYLYYKNAYIYNYTICLANTASAEARDIIFNDILAMVNTLKPEQMDFYLRLNIARAYSWYGNYRNKPAYLKKAEAYYNELILSYPNLSLVYVDFARNKEWQHDYKATLVILNQAINILPSTDTPLLGADHKSLIDGRLADIYDIMSNVYLDQKNYNQALTYYFKAFKIGPSLKLYRNIADAYYKLGNLNQAIYYNQRGLTVSPNGIIYALDLSLLYKEKGENNQALYYANYALKLEPDNKNTKSLINELNKRLSTPI